MIGIAVEIQFLGSSGIRSRVLQRKICIQLVIIIKMIWKFSDQQATCKNVNFSLFVRKTANGKCSNVFCDKNKYVVFVLLFFHCDYT